jgi:hypothetical protein
MPTHWDEIEKMRNKVGEFLQSSSFDRDQIYAMVMTSSELVENAVKYGDSESGIPVNIFVDVYDREVIIEVKNKIKDINDDQLRKLDENIQWIRGFQSHYEAYLEKIKHVSSKTLEDGESGLGLVRIAYEGQCILDFYINENDILSMSAVYKR